MTDATIQTLERHLVIIRPTNKVQKHLKATLAKEAQSDTALGSWFVNRLVIDRKPLLLFVSSKSRLVILDRAKDVKNLPKRFPGLVFERLMRLGAPLEHIGHEMDAMIEVATAPTNCRSVLGQLVDFARMLPYHLPKNDWDEYMLHQVEHEFAQTPCKAKPPDSRVIFPEDEALNLLNNFYGGPSTSSRLQ